MPSLWQTPMSHDCTKRTMQKMGIQPRPGFKNGEEGNAPGFRGFSHEMEAGKHEDAQKAFHPNGAKPRKPRRIRISRFF